MATGGWNPSNFEVELEEEMPSPSSLSSPSSPLPYFDRDRHVAFLEMMYNLMPYHYQSQEINRLTLAFFTISGLHLLQALDRVDKDRVANWVLSFQAQPRSKAELKNGQFYGFHGSRTSQFPPDENGSYDGCFGLMPGLESHGGVTYCAVASLRLMGYIEDDLLSKNASPSIINVPLLLDWSMQRQATDGGFQGRANKYSDTCYAFWVGAVLRILGGYKFIDKIALRRFLLTCQSEFGGFSNYPWGLPDLYHSYYGYTAFSLLEEPGLNPLCAELGMTDLAALGII